MHIHCREYAHRDCYKEQKSYVHMNLHKYLFFYLVLFLRIFPWHYVFLKSMLCKGFIVFHSSDCSMVCLTTTLLHV